jgi:nuclear pore complex protein Nup107
MNAQALLQDWLITSQKGIHFHCESWSPPANIMTSEEPEFKLLREAYLPDIVLAYDSILHCSGLALSRDNYLACMELSTIVAAEDSDLADLFAKKGRMQELVAAFAENSKALLHGNTVNKSRTGTNSKKIRTLGWTRELWDIKL